MAARVDREVAVYMKNPQRHCVDIRIVHETAGAALDRLLSRGPIRGTIGSEMGTMSNRRKRPLGEVYELMREINLNCLYRFLDNFPPTFLRSSICLRIFVHLQ